MSWIHVVAATLLVLGTVALFAFLRWAEALDTAEPASLTPAGPPLPWPPPVALAGSSPRGQLAAVDSTPYRHAA